MSQTISLLKKRLLPARYYELSLDGQFGKHTGHSWYLWNGLCPFHEDRQPGSLAINKANGAFRCFSCGAKGSDIISFHMQRHHTIFREAVIELRGMA